MHAWVLMQGIETLYEMMSGFKRERELWVRGLLGLISEVSDLAVGGGCQFQEPLPRSTRRLTRASRTG